VKTPVENETLISCWLVEKEEPYTDAESVGVAKMILFSLLEIKGGAVMVGAEDCSVDRAAERVLAEGGKMTAGRREPATVLATESAITESQTI